MVADGFTIRIFVPDGDPEGFASIDRLTSTGLAIVFRREDWPSIKQRVEFGKAGVYVLVGPAPEDELTPAGLGAELPRVYVGQGDGVRSRIEAHYQHKDFWDRGIVCVSKSSDAGLNRAHITWLEHALVARATDTARSHLDNGNAPQEPTLSEADKADVQVFSKKSYKSFRLSGCKPSSFPPRCPPLWRRARMR